MDPYLPTGNLQLTLGEIAEFVQGRLEGDPNLFIERLTDLATADADGIAFMEGSRQLGAESPRPAALLVQNSAVELGGLPCIRVESPREAFFRLLNRAAQSLALSAGVHPTAIIADSAIVDASASIGAYVSIGERAVIGAGVKLHPSVYVGPECVIGKNSILEPGACLTTHVRVGKRCLIHSGARLGTDGFGFFWNGSHHQKIPQVGRVVIEDDVEIGALTTVDRAMVGVTRIGRGSKLDNLIQVGHNVSIGCDTVIAACCAIGGTSTVGNRCVVGGSTQFSDHVNVVDDVRIGGGSAVASSIKEPGDYFGRPAMPAGEGKRNFIISGKLAELQQRVVALEKIIKDSEQGTK